MAAYRRVDDLTVTCRLTACTPGSTPGPTLGIEYGKPLSLPFLLSPPILFLQLCNYETYADRFVCLCEIKYLMSAFTSFKTSLLINPKSKVTLVLNWS